MLRRPIESAQFTCDAFTGVLKREGIIISMDGRGRVFDNIFFGHLWRTIKYEDIYLNGYANMGELMLGLTAYVAFHNEERFHQALGNATPANVYRTGVGGGAMILEKYGTAGGSSPAETSSTAEATTA